MRSRVARKSVGRKPWKVEALEPRCGTGWHVTFHDTFEAAIDMTLLRLYKDRGITQVKISRSPRTS